jgi:hypothetical protein
MMKLPNATEAAGEVPEEASHVAGEGRPAVVPERNAGAAPELTETAAAIERGRALLRKANDLADAAGQQAETASRWTER